MRRPLYSLITLFLALCLLVPALPAASGEGDAEQGSVSGTIQENMPDLARESSNTSESTVKPVRTEFTWKGRRAEAVFMTTATADYGLGDLGGRMLMLRVRCQEAEGFKYNLIDQRLFALALPSGKATQCRCHVVPSMSTGSVTYGPSGVQPFFDLLFDLDDLGGADPREASLAVYDERNTEPACLVSLNNVLFAESAEQAAREAPKPEIMVGSRVTFGRYEQNPDQDGSEPIVWNVLDKQDGKLFLLSVDSLDFRPYNEGFSEVTWETCSLREWLNGEFFGAAFSPEEQDAVALTHVDNSDSQGYFPSTHGGNDTEDRVFLLSYWEYNHYSKGMVKGNKPTDYAKSLGAEGFDWWLRSPGMVQIIGALINGGKVVTDTTMKVWNCVRPALWVDEGAVTAASENETEEADPDTKRALTPYNTCRVRMRYGYPYVYAERNNSRYAYENTLEWIVLGIQDGKALVIAGRTLQGMESSYKHDREWSQCKIRTRLAYFFLPRFFTQAERAAIIESKIVTETGNNEEEETTQDRIFLLSGKETMEYFAGEKYLRTSGEGESWWLRDSADTCINKNGELHIETAYGLKNGVRPAMYLDLKADLFSYDLCAETPEEVRQRKPETAEEPTVSNLYDRITDLRPGEIVTFGHFESYVKRPDGRTDIQWIVLDVQDGKALLLCRAGLIMSTYDQKGDNVSNLWETSGIRKKLNGEYLEKCFTPQERVLILTTDVDNSLEQGPETGKPAAKGNTKDRLFLLSYAEALRYFPTDSSRRAATEGDMYDAWEPKDALYYTEEGWASSDWWLRPVTFERRGNSNYVLTVDESGKCTYSPVVVRCMIRPAMWVRLDPEIIAYGLDRRIVFDNTTYAAYLGTPLKLTPEVERISDDGPEKTVMEWKSSDESVATVSGGTVKPVAPGKAVITASAKDNRTISASIEVEVRVPVKKIIPAEKELSLMTGAGEDKAAGQLHAKAEPENAFHTTLTWSSSDEKVATVDAAGTVSAVAPGKATVTAVTDDPTSKAKATFKVTVSQAVTELVPDQKEIRLAVGKTATVKVAAFPENAGNKKVVWSSSDETVATVSSSGKVKGISAGTAVITVTAQDGSGAAAEITVTVE